MKYIFITTNQVLPRKISLEHNILLCEVMDVNYRLLRGGHFIIYANPLEPLCCMPETNIYVNYISKQFSEFKERTFIC